MITTIFTPTRNRAPYLERQFESLQLQTDKNFEWIIIDNDSTDNTETVSKNLIDKADGFGIRYFRNPDGFTKHSGINYGIQFVRGELLLITDDKETLATQCIATLHQYYSQIKDNPNICGIVFLLHFFDNTVITENPPNNNIISDFFSYRAKLHIRGDVIETVKTDIYKQYLPFPIFENEVCCPEGLIMNRIARKYKALYIANSEPLVYAEYLTGGLSSQWRIGGGSWPRASRILYNEKATMPTGNLMNSIKCYTLYWYNTILSKVRLRDAYEDISQRWGIICLPLGWILYLLIKNGKLYKIEQ